MFVDELVSNLRLIDTNYIIMTQIYSRRLISLPQITQTLLKFSAKKYISRQSKLSINLEWFQNFWYKIKPTHVSLKRWRLAESSTNKNNLKFLEFFQKSYYIKFKNTESKVYFWRRIIFLIRNFIFGPKFYFWSEILFSVRNCIFGPNLYFWSEILFLVRNSIFLTRLKLMTIT